MTYKLCTHPNISRVVTRRSDKKENYQDNDGKTRTRVIGTLEEGYYCCTNPECNEFIRSFAE